jgi:hypothetical protein
MVVVVVVVVHCMQSLVPSPSPCPKPSSRPLTNGLRVLGAPIGSAEFASTFMSNILAQAISDSKKLLTDLEDIQTMTRLFSNCTIHKITHLLSSDVFHSPISSLPNLFYLWESNLCDKFNCMVDNFLSDLTNLETLPPHAHIIASMSINQGGLGLQNPRGNAITSYMTSSKRYLQYAFEGVWLGRDPRQTPSNASHFHYLPVQHLGD